MYQILRKLPPREYSISSSFMATPDEVHITVGTVRYQAHGRERKGVCSVHFAERIKRGDIVPIYLKKNPNFKFPMKQDIPVIMIGPGTGIAPFRAYLQEREELGMTGKHGCSLAINTVVLTFYMKKKYKNGSKMET